MDIKNLSSFSRTIANEAKAGAYYTNVEHCEMISKMLKFPQKATVLEPSVGDGSAVLAVTDKNNNPNTSIFGVELDTLVAKETKESGFFEEVINADFLENVKISNNTFSMVFGNPPYMENAERRAEISFLEKVTNYLKTSGVCVWVIPESVAVSQGFLRSWCTRYETKLLYRFKEWEYRKWKQVVLIGRKKSNFGHKTEEVEELLKRFEGIEEIPENYEGELVEVPIGDEKDVKFFSTLSFNEEEALEVLRKKQVLKKIVDEQAVTKQYECKGVGSPPMPLKKDSLYLCAVSGIGQGMAGSRETKDLHLQRGVAKVVEDSYVDLNDKGKEIMVVTSSTKVKMNILQNDGTFVSLQ